MKTLAPLLLLFPVVAQDAGVRRVAQDPSTGNPAKTTPLADPRNPVPGGEAPTAAPPADAEVRLRANLSGKHHQTEVLFDQPSADEPLWALGANYKIAVQRDRWSYRAATPATARGVSPIHFRLESAAVGSTELPIGGSAPVRRDGASVYLDHGVAEERLDLRLADMEQSFVFRSLPTRGELRVAIVATSDLRVEADGAGLRFAGDGTDIRYGAAVAIDADGDRVAAPTRFVDGRIEIRVPAAFVAAADLPLVIDPIIVSQVVASGANDHAHPDIVYVPNGTQWHVAYNRFFGPGDWDCFVQRYDSALTAIGGAVSVDNTGGDWFRPRIAHLNAGDVSLVVAEVRPVTGPVRVRGRLVGASGTLPGSPFDIAVAGVDSLVPDVGADPNGGIGYFTVVWEHAYSASDHDIYCRQLTNTGVLRGAGPTFVQTNTFHQTNPTISKSCGSTSGNERNVIVYQQRTLALDHDIHGCLLTWDGTIVTVGGNNTFPIDTSTSNHERPQVSTPSRPVSDGSRRILVAYENTSAFGGDIDVAAINQSGTVLQRANLQVLEGASVTRRGYTQSFPAVDCDGTRFAVTYQEPWQGNQDLECRIAEVSYGNGQLFAQNPTSFRSSVAGEFATQVGSQYAGDGFAHATYGLVNDRDSATGYGIDAALFDAAPTGALGVRATGCGGGIGISRSGNLTPGGTVTYTLVNLDPIAGFAIGQPASTPIPGCATCTLGVTDFFTQVGTVLPVFVPVDPNLIGASLSVQGWMLGTPATSAAACLGFLHLSDTHDIVVR